MRMPLGTNGSILLSNFRNSITRLLMASPRLGRAPSRRASSYLSKEARDGSVRAMSVGVSFYQVYASTLVALSTAQLLNRERIYYNVAA